MSESEQYDPTQEPESPAAVADDPNANAEYENPGAQGPPTPEDVTTEQVMKARGVGQGADSVTGAASTALPTGREDEPEVDSSADEQQQQRAQADIEQAQSQQAPADVPQDNYADSSKEELQGELDKRGLPTTGNKPELIARLRENDVQEQNEQA